MLSYENVFIRIRWLVPSIVFLVLPNCPHIHYRLITANIVVLASSVLDAAKTIWPVEATQPMENATENMD